ncbi:MAG: hypothetical protein R3Y26_02935 [Rikenellaceae bacterium]
MRKGFVFILFIGIIMLFINNGNAQNTENSQQTKKPIYSLVENCDSIKTLLAINDVYVYGEPTIENLNKLNAQESDIEYIEVHQDKNYIAKQIAKNNYEDDYLDQVIIFYDIKLKNIDSANIENRVKQLDKNKTY